MKQDEIKKLLPAVFGRTVHAGNPMSAFLDIMEGLHAPAEELLANVDLFFDPHRTPDEFVAFLAHWVDLNNIFVGKSNSKTNFQSPLMPQIGHLRELIANAAYLSQWRGTKKGLLLFLRIATGETDFEIDERITDEQGKIRPFHLQIYAPLKVQPEKDLIIRIIESEKPVHVTYELEFKSN